MTQDQRRLFLSECFAKKSCMLMEGMELRFSNESMPATQGQTSSLFLSFYLYFQKGFGKMDKITIARKELLVNAVLELHWVPEDAYNDILHYIRKRTGERDDAVEEVMREDSGEKEKPAEPETVNLYGLVKVDSGIKDEMQKFVWNLYFKWRKNPDKYDLVMMSAKEFIEHFDSIACVKLSGPISIGKILGTVARRYGKGALPVEKKRTLFPCGAYAPVTVYSVPVEKLQTEEDCAPQAEKTIGSVIRGARERDRLSRSELADLIGYPRSSVIAWEEDRYIPSSDALSLMESVFGDDLFAGVKTLPRVH